MGQRSRRRNSAAKARDRPWNQRRRAEFCPHGGLLVEADLVKTLLMTATAGALSLAALMGTAHAATVFANTTTLASGSNFIWTNNGLGNSGSGGTLTGSGTTAFSFENLSSALNMLALLPANFALTASTAGTPATFSGSPNNLWAQTGLSGDFSYTFAGATGTKIGGITLTNGENLLSGTFSGAWIQGNGGSGAMNLSVSNGGSMSFSSAVDPAIAQGLTPEFAYTLLNVAPAFGAASSGAALESFTGKGDGEFSLAAVGVPEPATWAMMIVGFGGLGGLLRGRRRQAFAAG